MGKPNKNKNAQNEPNSKKNSEEVEESKVEEKIERPALTAAQKKLLAQQERERKEEEELEKLKKLKAEGEKKKKNSKASNKTKTKQDAPTFKAEEKPVSEAPKSKNTRYENDANRTRFQETRKPENSRNADVKDSWLHETGELKNTRMDEAYEATRKSKYEQNESKRFPENTGTSNGNWRNSAVAKPDHSFNRPSAYDGNNYGGRRSSYNYTFSDGKNDEQFQKFLKASKDFTGKVREESGDLFNAPNEYSLAHCVAEDFSMGAGIAKEFKAKFKRVTKLLDQNAGTGGLAILDDNDRFIYYLVTKQLSRGKPTLYTLWKSLLKLRDHITEHKVSKLAIPQIGCGLDRLDWVQVKRMLEYVFNKNEIDIVVYILDFNADETPNPSRAPRKCYVVHSVLPLIDIQAQTGLIFLGTEDGAVTHEMDCLSVKYDFVNSYKMKRKSTGDVIKIVDRGEYLYGLIIRRSLNNRIIFADFEKCLFNLRKMLKTDKTVYIGLQGFVEKDDEVITEKLVNLMQYILQDVEIWVCWPKELAGYCPPQKQ